MRQLIGFCFILLFFSVKAQQVRVVLDTTNISISTPAHYIIQIQLDQPTDSYHFPTYQIGDSLSSGLEILNITYDTLQVNQKETYEQNIEFTAWEEGTYYIESQRVIVNKDALYTKRQDIYFNDGEDLSNNMQNSGGINDIKGIIYEPTSFWEWLSKNWWIILIILLIIGLIYGIIRYSKMKKPVKELETTKFSRLQAESIQKLKKLEAQQLMQQGNSKQFYRELSEILRDFIEQRFHVRANELLTNELLSYMSKYKVLSEDSIQTISPILRRADLAKFAKIKPSVAEGENDIRNSISWIESIPSESIISQNTNPTNLADAVRES